MNTRRLLGIRKAFALIGILSVLSSLVVFAPIASAYTGADATAIGLPWAAVDVDAACESGIIDCSLTPHNLGKDLNRAEFSTMALRANGLEFANPACDFSDIDYSDENMWWANEGCASGILGWFTNDAFQGDLPVTRAMMATVFMRMLDLPEGDVSVLDQFVDKDDIQDWQTPYLAAAVESGLIKGGDDHRLNPNNVAKKAEAIVLMNRVAQYVTDNEIDVLQVAADATGTDTDALQTALNVDSTVTEGEPEVPPTGSASVALAADTPLARIIASGTAFNPLMKFNVTAGSDADVKLTGLKVTRGGLSSSANVTGVSAYDMAGVRHGNVGSSWNDDNTMDLDFSSEPITVEKGTTEAIWLKANLATGTLSGTLFLSVAATTDLHTTATLAGAFPLVSNTMDLRDGTSTVAAVTVDAVQVNSNGNPDGTTAVSVNLGTTRQHITTFRVTNSSVESVKLSSMTLYNNGSAADADIKNCVLVSPDGTDLKTVDTSVNKYLRFDGLDYPLAKNASSKDFKVYCDIANGSTRTVRLLLQNDYDLVVTGDTSGAQILPTLAAVTDTAFPVGDRVGAGNFINMLTVAAGTLSFSKASTSPTGNIAAGAVSQVLGRWEVKSNGEDMEIRQFSYAVVRSGANNLSGTLYFRLQEKKEDGKYADLSTLYSISGATADYSNNSTAYTTNFVKLTAGKQYYIAAIGDILSSEAAGATYTVSALDLTQVKRLSTNDIVDPTVNVANANTLTVKTGTLTVTANGGAPAINLVSGQANIATLGTWSFTAGSGEGIEVSNVIVGDNTAGLGRNFKDLELWANGVKVSQDTSSTIAPTATTATVTFNISPAVDIAASATATFELKGRTLTTPLDVGGTVITDIEASGVTGVGKTSRTALNTVPAAAVNGETITLNTAGTLTVTRDTVTNLKQSQLVAGATNVVFGAYKLQTGDIENIKIKKITVRNIGTNANGFSSVGIYDGATLVNNLSKAALGSDTAELGNDNKSVTFDYSATPLVITKNTSKVLSVKANTVYQATNGSTAQFVIDSIEAEGEGSSSRLYVTQTSETASAASTNAFAVGEVVASGSSVAGAAFSADCSVPAACNGAAVITTAVAAGASLIASGVPVAGVDGDVVQRLTKMNVVMNGSNIVSELATAASTYPYTTGDVVVITDGGTIGNTNAHVVTSTVAVGGDIEAANTLVNGINLDNGVDRVTRIPSGAGQSTVLGTSVTSYNVGDIVVVSDVSTSANNGFYVVTNAINAGGDLTAAAVVASQVVQLASGAALVAGDAIAKMPTQSTEAVSTSAIYAYAVGDVIVVNDADAPANNGLYVVRTAVAVGATLVGNTLGTGVTFTASDRISKLYVKGQEDNLKKMYATKLNFAWTAPSVGSLTTGNQVETARFVMGADVANANNPGVTATVTALAFTNLSTARLSNLTLNDVTNNQNVATNANATTFSSAVVGGSMPTLTFQQGESRTFKVLADVATNAGSQVAQLRFNAGTAFTAGSATWQTGGQTSTWTVLAGDAADVSSTNLTSASTGSDTAAPTVAIVFSGGVANNSVFDETLTATFNEEVDPVTINSGLVYGGSLAAQATTAGGGVIIPAAAALTMTITNVATLTTNFASDAVGVNGTTTVALNAAGTVLTITPAGYTAWHATAATGDGGAQTVTATGSTVRDTAGNLLTATGSTETDSDL